MQWLFTHAAEGDADTDKLSRSTENAVEGATLVVDIIRRIREFVQKGDAQHSAVDLNRAVSNVAALVKYEARHHDVQIRLDLDERLPLVEGDMIQLE